MQSAPPTLQRSGVVLALNRYSAAVRDMEQTVLLPSLLRDASCDRSRDDLYRDYLTLKAIRNTVESGLVSLDDHKTDAAAHRTPEPLTERHAEALFHFHLTGLWSVMKDLTHKTQTLTDKYKDIIGISH